MSTPPNVGPLAGVRVIDLTRFPPGAYCTVMLADLGAEIVHVEPPSAAGRRSTGAEGVGLSRGKRSITLDQRQPAAAEILRRLAASADVLVENAVPGQMDRRGFGYSHAAVEFPSLIWCSLSGFGQDGPYATRAGHDLTYLAHSGLLAGLTPALPWHPQTMLSVPLGAIMAAIGVLGALVERARTGQGCQVDVSLAEACTWLLSGNDSNLTANPIGIGQAPGRRLYECSDGEFISVAAAEPGTWAAMCDALGLPDLSDAVQATVADDPVVLERLAAVFRTRPAPEWVDELGPLGTAVGAVNRGPAVITDPHYVARRATVEIDGVHVPASPVRLRDLEGPRSATATTPPAPLGADTDDVLAGLGYSADQIATFRADGIIG
jgi:crotonobetainyl-CoA:carnitine CoA-transferase CaiB-like acyl-CoA transferase